MCNIFFKVTAILYQLLFKYDVQKKLTVYSVVFLRQMFNQCHLFMDLLNYIISVSVKQNMHIALGLVCTPSRVQCWFVHKYLFIYIMLPGGWWRWWGHLWRSPPPPSCPCPWPSQRWFRMSSLLSRHSSFSSTATPANFVKTANVDTLLLTTACPFSVLAVLPTVQVQSS